MKTLLIFALVMLPSVLLAASLKVDVRSMPRVVFTGDSQTCGRVGAWDYAQMLSWEQPVHVINTAVGGTNTTHLLNEQTGGTAEAKAGEYEVRGQKVGWGAGPYPGQTIRLGAQSYTIDRIEVRNYRAREVSVWLTEPAREDFSGTDHAVEPGWRVRIAERRPDFACFMYSVNDTGHTSEQFTANIRELVEGTRALGAEPVLLSGIPLMVAELGGSHPGDNVKVDVRADDLLACSVQFGVPYADIFHSLMLLDEPCTATWVDTVHPTSDGSTLMLVALRRIFDRLDLADNPYFVRGYRAGELCAPDEQDALTPISTSQPDYNIAGQLDDDHFDLASIHARDEYELIAEADGDALVSDRPLLLRFGVGHPSRLQSIDVKLVTTAPATASAFDWRTREWRKLTRGQGELSATVAAEDLRALIHRRCLWLAVHGAESIELDYAGLTLEGDPKPWAPRRAAGAMLWPEPGALIWTEDAGNLVANGNVAAADEGVPTGWQILGDDATYIRGGVLAEGLGELKVEGRWGAFTCPTGDLALARPLDVLEVMDGSEEEPGRYLIRSITEDGTALLRRRPAEPAAGLRFELLRSSGCLAVPGGCAIGCRGESYWQSAVRGLQPGEYRLGFYFRAYDPPAMKAKGGPGRAARVDVALNAADTLASTGPLVTAYHWQRAWLKFTVLEAGDLLLQPRAEGDTTVEFTGFSLQRRER